MHHIVIFQTTIEKRSRYTANLIVLLIYAFCQAIRCTTLTRADPNICPIKIK